MAGLVQRHNDLKVYQQGRDVAMVIFQLSRAFPKEERYALTDQIRRSSRSVCANIAEAWRKRRYERAFVSKLSDAEAEVAETQVWIEFALLSGYIDETVATSLDQAYEQIIRMLVGMMMHSDRWTRP